MIIRKALKKELILGLLAAGKIKIINLQYADDTLLFKRTNIRTSNSTQIDITLFRTVVRIKDKFQ